MNVLLDNKQHLEREHAVGNTLEGMHTAREDQNPEFRVHTNGASHESPRDAVDDVLASLMSNRSDGSMSANADSAEYATGQLPTFRPPSASRPKPTLREASTPSLEAGTPGFLTAEQIGEIFSTRYSRVVTSMAFFWFV